ncbi:MAG: hypothetical protein AAGC90_03685 [Curtobacterium sp.]
MSQIETSPGGVGFIRTTAKKSIPASAPSNTAARRGWLVKRSGPVVAPSRSNGARSERNAS